MKKNFVLVAFISATMAAGSLGMAAPAVSQKESEQEQEAKLARQAKITKEQAQETALKRAPGNVESAELEREHGKLVYSFDIRNAKGTIDEVQVSAITGKVVRVEHENKKQEAAEKRKEAKEKKQ
jgi:uncharacterized membrane protein YkoI